MTDYHIRSTCRLCASPDLERLLTLPDTPLANEYQQWPDGEKVQWPGYPVICRTPQDCFPLYLVGCASCGHVQLPVVVDPKRLFPPDYPYQSGTSAVFREHLIKLAVTIAGTTCAVNALDIACNDGSLVYELRRQGIQADGIDPAAPLDTGMWQTFFTEEWAKSVLPVLRTKYDVITALNVFAHVDDLDDFTRGVKTLLEPCGLFVIEVGYLPDVVTRNLWDTIYHEHLAYHHLAPLVRFFRKHGMTMVDAHRIDSQGGSVRIYVRNCDKQHVGGDDGHNGQSARLQALLDDEGRSALWEGVRGFTEAIRGYNSFLHNKAKRYGQLAVYGAPAKLTTLLHATDKTGVVAFVVDDNPLKVGRYVPGTRIPIKPVSALYEAKPKAVVIASWNFADDIKSKHAELETTWLVPHGGPQ